MTPPSSPTLFKSISTRFSSVYNSINHSLRTRLGLQPTKSRNIRATPAKLKKKSKSTGGLKLSFTSNTPVHPLPQSQSQSQSTSKSTADSKIRSLEKKIEWLVQERLASFEEFGGRREVGSKIDPESIENVGELSPLFNRTGTAIPAAPPPPSADFKLPQVDQTVTPKSLKRTIDGMEGSPNGQRSPGQMNWMLSEIKSVKLKSVPRKTASPTEPEKITSFLSSKHRYYSLQSDERISNQTHFVKELERKFENVRNAGEDETDVEDAMML